VPAPRAVLDQIRCGDVQQSDSFETPCELVTRWSIDVFREDDYIGANSAIAWTTGRPTSFGLVRWLRFKVRSRIEAR
jgi:hypothetical protein